MSIFEKIVQGDIPSFKVWEDDEFYSFLDIRPVAPGHSLVIPKKAVDPVFSMDDEAYQRFFMAAKKVSAILKSKIACERICLSVVGFEVPHAHIHLIPCRSIQDFPWPGGKQAEMEELEKVWRQLTT